MPKVSVGVSSQVNLSGTEVTHEGIERLAGMLPKCYIYHRALNSRPVVNGVPMESLG